MYDFLVCFYVLDHCFWSHTDRNGMKHTDDLGILLGEMDPEMMEDGMPIDMAVLAKWREIFTIMPKSDAEWIDVIEKFLDYYEKNDGFDFPLSRPLLKGASALEYVPAAKEKAKETCGRHNY